MRGISRSAEQVFALYDFALWGLLVTSNELWQTKILSVLVVTAPEDHHCQY
jgi:hypothetical protein